MSKHTPLPTQGKWTWYWKEVDGETECGVVSDKGYSVCRAPRYQTREQWEADGPLLAAAPELLEALEGWIWARENGASEDLAEKYARAAIAKATPGETPR